MSQTLETWGKLMGAGAVLKGGIAGANKGLKKLSPEARMERVQKKQKNKQDKEIAKIEKEAAKQFLRDHGSMLQGMADRMSGSRALAKAEEAAALVTSQHVEKMKKELKDEKASKDSGDKDEKVRGELQGTAPPKADKSPSVSPPNASGLGGAAVDTAADDGPKREKTGGRQKGTLNKPKEDIAPSSGGISVEGESLGLDESNAMYVTDGGIVELLSISRESHQLDQERSQREIKAERRALEDRRDAKKGSLMGAMKGSPSLNKATPKPSWFADIGKSLLSLGTKYLLPIVTSTAGLIGLKKFLQGANNADDIANAAGKIDELAKGVKTITPHIDEGLKGVAKTSQLINYGDEFVKAGTHLDEGLKGVAKTSQLVNYGDDFVKMGTHFDEGLKGVAKTSQLINYADDFGRIPGQVTGAIDGATDLARAGTYVDDFGRIPGQVSGATSNLARSSQIVNYADDFAAIPGQATRAIDGATDLARAGTYADDFAGVGRNITAGTNALQGTLKGGVKSSNVGKLSTAIDGLSDASRGISTTISSTAGKVDNVAVGVQGVSGKLSAMDDFARLAAGKADDAARAATLARNIATGVPTANPTSAVGVIDDVVDAGASTTRAITAGADATGDAARLAAQNAEELAKTLKVGAKTGTGLLGRFAKILTPLDIFNKMGQGQTLSESIANMGVELSSMAVGGTDWAAEGLQKLTGLGSGEGFIKEGAWGDSSRALEVGDVMGNKDKWQTSYLEQGINSAIAWGTGTEKTANAKTWTAEQEAMAKAADDRGAVNVGYGRGEIDDLEELTLLDPASLQALLDYEVWSDKDMKMLEDLKRAKEQGVSIEYEKTMWGLGAGKVNFGPGMTDGSPTNNAGGGRKAELDRLSGEMQAPGVSGEDYRKLETEFFKVKAMSPEEFDALTPNAELQDTMNAAAVNPGSIFTHDMHVEKAFQDLFSGTKTLGSAEAIPSEVLQAAVISASAIAEKHSKGGGGAGQLINAPTSIDNSSSQVIAPASTAHSPAMPSGMGSMGVSTPRG